MKRRRPLTHLFFHRGNFLHLGSEDANEEIEAASSPTSGEQVREDVLIVCVVKSTKRSRDVNL